MKRTYCKPDLHIEYFTLSQSIAAGCGAAHWDELTGGPNHASKSTCGWTDSFGDVYWSTPEACGNGGNGYVVDEDFEMDGVCYNNPNGGHSIFNS